MTLNADRSPACEGARFPLIGLLLAIALSLTAVPAAASVADDGYVAEIETAISLERVQPKATSTGQLGAFSPDGRRFAFVTWRGDLERNANVYSLKLIERRDENGFAAPRVLYSAEFAGDPGDQHASPIEQIAFTDDGTAIAFIGRGAGDLPQIFRVALDSGAVVQLTHFAAPVRQFALGPDGASGIAGIAVEAPGEAARRRLIEEQGLLLTGENGAYQPAPAWIAGSVLRDRTRRVWRWVSFDASGQEISRFAPYPEGTGDYALSRAESDRGFRVDPEADETLKTHGSISRAPGGNRILLSPYDAGSETEAAARSSALEGEAVDWADRLIAPVAEIDAGSTQPAVFSSAFKAAPQTYDGAAKPIWAPDGQSVLLFAVPAGGKDAKWIEASATGTIASVLPVPANWTPLAWGADGSLVLTHYNSVAVLEKQADGAWGELREIGHFPQLNRRWRPVSDGKVLIGLFEGIDAPPDLYALDLTTMAKTRLTDLNPQLAAAQRNPVQRLRWSSIREGQGEGYLIVPPNHDARRSYPLVILLDDGALREVDDVFLFDGALQLSGHAAQMTASAGMYVLYLKEPTVPFMGEGECQAMTKHVEAALDALPDDVRIDPRRIAVSGWSRAGYHTDCLIRESAIRFRAASRIDGGGMEFIPRLRPYSDAELQAIDTALLIQTHGPANLVLHTMMADRLRQFGKPLEVLYLAAAPHATVRPSHRLASLVWTLDWWRFWLLDEERAKPSRWLGEDADSLRVRYARWQRLKSEIDTR